MVRAKQHCIHVCEKLKDSGVSNHLITNIYANGIYFTVLDNRSPKFCWEQLKGAQSRLNGLRSLA